MQRNQGAGHWLWPLVTIAACGGPAETDFFRELNPGVAGAIAMSRGGDAEDSGGEASSEGGAAGARAPDGGRAGRGDGGRAAGGRAAGGRAGNSNGGTAAAGKGGGASGGSGHAGRGGGGGGGHAGNAGIGGASGSGGIGGAAGASATCPGDCDVNADCSVDSGTVVCSCRSEFIGDGKSCARPTSCKQLHRARPSLASGTYTLAPHAADAPFSAYCEMTAEAGGWTLILNEGPSFDATTAGLAGVQCYEQECTSLAYSTVPVESDVMLDMRDGALLGANYLARVIVNGVATATRGKTVRTLFNSGPFYLEKEDNSNLTLRLSGDASCEDTLPFDMADLVCNSCTLDPDCYAPVIVFGDADPGCVDEPQFRFAIGAAYSYSSPWTNCAGWPQNPNAGGEDYYPHNFRIWVR